MTFARNPILAASLLALALPFAAHADQAPAPTAAAATAFEQRAAQLVALFEGGVAYDEYFDTGFQAAVSEAQFQAMRDSLVAQYGRVLRVENLRSTDGRSGTLDLRFEKGVAAVTLDVGADRNRRVAGLRLSDVTMDGDSFPAVAADIAALPGRTGFLVAEIDGRTITPLAAARPDTQLAVGSTFKLYVLDELAAQVAAGKRRWSDVVPLSHASFSSAATANWPANTPVTLQTLANWMISVSDNGATDTLIHLLGRDAIETRMTRAGHSEPSRNIPFLTTVEAFALKGNNFTAAREAFIGADDRMQRRVIADHRDRLILSNVDGVSFSGGPRFIDDLEWFASPNDVARAMIDLRARRSDTALSALAINNGVGPAAAAGWRWLGYKGGSELGVMSMSLLGQRKSDGKWFVVTASWNNADAALDEPRFVGLVTRLLKLAAG